MKINIEPRHLKIVKEILFKFIPDTEVWAFGSRVKFTNTEYSDLDLVINGEKKQSLSTMAKLEEAFEESDLPFEVDILDYCSIAEHLKKEINKKYMKLIDPKSVKEGYKDTPLGLIPEDWEVVSSGEICELTAGGTPSTSISEYWGGSIRWMNSGEINKKRVDEVEGRITEEGLKNSSTKILPIHCVLIALAGQGKTRGTVAINEVELCTNQSIAAFIPKEKVLYEYLFFNLDNRYDELRSLSAGDGGRGGLNLSILRAVQIPLPSLEEQKKIAEILSTWDQGIDKLTALIERKKHLKKGLMQKLLTGRVRFKEFVIKQGFQDTELGLIPQDWQVVRLGDVCEFINGKAHENNISEDGRYCVVNSKFISSEGVVRKNSNEGFCIAKASDILMVMSDVPNGKAIGKCFYVEDSNVYTVNQRICILRSQKNNSNFLFFLVNRNKYFLSFDDGVKQTNLRKEEVLALPIPLPPLEEQKKIAEILSTQDKEIDKLEKKLELFKQQKKGLMQILLTGRVRV
jgi:type I restriction enzyme, S subunit